MSSAFPSKEKDSGAKKDRPSGVAAILGANAPANRRGSDSPHIIESRPLAAGHSRQQLPQSTMANQMPSQSQSQFFIPTNLIQTPFPQQLVIPHNFGQFPGQAQLLLNPQGTPLGIVAPCQPRQHGQQQLIYGNDGRLHRPRSPPQQQQQQQQCAPPRINPAFLRAPSARDQPRIYPPLLPAPAPMHISENSGPVPIAPAPQHQHQQPSFLQLIGGNNMILQRLPNGVITLVQQPAHQQGQLFLQPQQMHSQQPIANNFLGDGSSSNHHIPPNIEAPKEPEPIDLPPPLILGGGTSTIEEDVDIHELFMKEVEKHASAKPDVITHILDGFYIQESFEPFPIDAYGCIEALVPHEAIQN
uniref:Uncharacterized protein n=1 Tax=Plectus sambesii TaxID=2011161 RepID=A0A914UU50_9BILA